MRRDEVAAVALPAGKSDHLIPDGTVPGLALRLRGGGKRTWVFTYRIGRKQRRISLGSATAFSVQEVRRRAAQLYALGHDPAKEKEDAKLQAAETVKAKLPLYLARQQDRVRTGGESPARGRQHLRQSSYIEIERHLLVHAKRLHPKPLAEIARRDVAALLSALTEKLSVATVNRVQSSLSGFFAWTIGEGLIDSNPVDGTDRRDEDKRTRLIGGSELNEIWSALRDDAYGDVMRLLILTGARAREIGGLRWSEVDLMTRFIVLKPERTKNKRQHEIFLSDSALDILRARPRLNSPDGTPCDLIFGRGRLGFNDWAGSKLDLDRRIGQARRAAGVNEPMPPWTVHDFRRLISTTMHDHLKILPHVVEVVLGHVGHQSGTAGRYNLALYRVEKAAALTRWAEHVGAIVEGRNSMVLPLRA
jgi:integrase